MKNGPSILAAFLFVSLYILLFPFYRYSLDIDGISYLDMSRRYASGGFFSSINGYWSPLGSWILVPFVKAGTNLIITAKVINGFLGLLGLLSSIRLLNRFKVNPFLRKIVPLAFAMLFLSFCFYELFADLLVVVLLTLYFNLLFSDDFIKSPIKLASAGILGALAYFAKAYCFPFFLLHISISCLFLIHKNYPGNYILPYLKSILLVFTIFFALTGPYIWGLSKKYDTVLISTSGKLNSTWLLAPGNTSEDRMVVVPPYKEAVSSWDEPIYNKDRVLSPFSSFTLFLKQLKLTAGNSWVLLKLMAEISIFNFLIIPWIAYFLIKIRKEAVLQEWLLFISILLFPSGYLLILIEWRYIWILPILLLITGSILLTRFIPNKMIPFAGVVMTLSFIIQPVMELIKNRDNNKASFEMADIFKREGIQGNFFINDNSMKAVANLSAVCYLTGSKLLGPYKSNYTRDEWNKAVAENDINYYICFYHNDFEKETIIRSSDILPVKRTYTDLYPGVIVFRLN